MGGPARQALTLRSCAYVLRSPAVQALTLPENVFGTVHEPGDEVLLRVEDSCWEVRPTELLCVLFFLPACPSSQTGGRWA